ncbi:MAG: 1-(5-phosphoribosyl)-5-[(5-phosphoribosylamino)methylideneamino]imidazole-4-carboxamide isomerase [Nitrospira sp.]|nr:1-(5-phosphoribosyl)-5-[(5-phosphoribosylamino)methylideneamino]imidazole-4-carboxamide isomerase [Nitrospira sp.]MCB9709839.1 1-(5-phosphoribosyl)-5-[(5-phosphoribosylamino)methylideneamino]imidazole-4-carboxamide isomerase [Nitrospiraceae bacterium]MDR4485954.1 1-(5-phosphoribosyl)-5-[(5-phosphoribosylamino)methylideneamino]imidazole-4-carboxamide isomerase [Nitrospirales bacterium]MCA9463927.1 1-(5-phosphoribosyl)-5-[(5-phosphoribosylamino)methylideneamino]imidazole-4-carboxamide isomerase
MLLIPAIDLKDGKCVRLRQGAMDQVTRYSDDPLGMAAQWQNLGARYLHVVDLDGAVTGHPQHLPQIEAIAHRPGLRIQVGGGIRQVSTIQKYLDVGVDRVVVGTAALHNPEFLSQAATTFPGKVLLGIDMKNGCVAVQGWTEVSTMKPQQLFESLGALPLAGVVFTDISKDGMLEGPNLSALKEAAEASPVPVVASGGVTSLQDVQAIQALHANISAIIIGKALYEGTLNLTEAFTLVGENRGASL